MTDLYSVLVIISLKKIQFDSIILELKM